MKKPRNTFSAQTSRNAGFSLIEVLAVMTIIMLLAGTFIALSGFARRKSMESAAKAEIASIDTALEQYKLAIGVYPPNLSTLTNGFLKGFSTNRFDGTGIKDPFFGAPNCGGHYQYINNGSIAYVLSTYVDQKGSSMTFSNVGPQ